MTRYIRCLSSMFYTMKKQTIIVRIITSKLKRLSYNAKTFWALNDMHAYIKMQPKTQPPWQRFFFKVKHKASTRNYMTAKTVAVCLCESSGHHCPVLHFNNVSIQSILQSHQLQIVPMQNGPIDYPVFYLISSKNIPPNGLKVIKVFSCKFQMSSINSVFHFTNLPWIPFNPVSFREWSQKNQDLVFGI